MTHYSVIQGIRPDSTPYESSRSFSRADHPPQGYPDTKNQHTYAYETAVGHNADGKRYYRFSEWYLELFAWVAGTAIIAGLVVILVKFNNSPVHDWPFSIQISTVVAFLAQIAQAALLRLVHMGALITVFMLVFSTFFQQAVQTRLDPLEYRAQQVTVPRLKDYRWPHSPRSYSDGYLYTNDITGSKSITLPGIEIESTNEILTTWVTTFFGMANGTIDAVGPIERADLTHPELKLTNPDSNLDDLAHIYLACQDPCRMKDTLDSSKESWMAFKGTIRLCLQTLKTIHNTSTDTTLVGSYTNLTWTAAKAPLPPQVSVLTRGQGNWTTRLDNNPENFTIDFATTELLGGQLATSFNLSASFVPGGDNYFYGSMFASNFVSEVLGPDPLICPNSTEYGIKAFDKRMANVATGLTNAVPVWKSSQLAVLYALHEPEKLGTKSDMEKEAERTQLRFRGTRDWQMEHD
ncbi:hypothetical protein N0V90_007932 [Kalmusia sp. IMI 367209]|nr:hypothetical protein N0V90_007932 [Kalmusia sp. IMI 367209]